MSIVATHPPPKGTSPSSISRQQRYAKRRAFERKVACIQLEHEAQLVELVRSLPKARHRLLRNSIALPAIIEGILLRQSTAEIVRVLRLEASPSFASMSDDALRRAVERLSQDMHINDHL